jgi:hypothetical protein
MYATNLFLDQVLTWWNNQVQTLGDDAAYSLSWLELKELMIAEYCPASEVQKLETEFWNLTMVGPDVAGYTSRFHDLSRLVPRLVTPESKKVERYLFGLAPQIRGMVTASKPTTMREAIDLALSLTEDAIRMGTLIRKVSGLKLTESSSVEGKNLGTSSAVGSSEQGNRPRFGKRKRDERKKDGSSGSGKKGKGYVATGRGNNGKQGYQGKNEVICGKCRRSGHKTEDCRSGAPKNSGARPCFSCGSLDHWKRDCPKLNNQARGRAFVIGAGDARQDPNVVTGTFPLNGHYASVLFDTGADFSFVSVEFKRLLGLKTSKLDTPYSIELANGKTIETREVAKDCKLDLCGHEFDIELLPVVLGSFDIVVGMDWLSAHRAVVVCNDKVIQVPLASGETLSIQGERRGTPLRIITSMKARKCLRKGLVAFLAHVVDKKADERKLEDIPIARDFPDVFPEDLPGLPPPRQVEFRIDLVPGAAPVARSPYRLAPSEMQELSEQL